MAREDAYEDKEYLRDLMSPDEVAWEEPLLERWGAIYGKFKAEVQELIDEAGGDAYLRITSCVDRRTSFRNLVFNASPDGSHPTQ